MRTWSPSDEEGIGPLYVLQNIVFDHVDERLERMEQRHYRLGVPKAAP